MDAEARADALARVPDPQVPWTIHLRYWLVVALWMALISYLSTDAFSATNTHLYVDPLLRWFFPDISNPEVLQLHGGVRKLAHFTEFFVLGGLTIWAQRAGRPIVWRLRWMLNAMLLVIGYSLVDEIHQAFTHDRTPALADSGIDMLGGAVAQALLYLRHRLRSGF